MSLTGESPLKQMFDAFDMQHTNYNLSNYQNDLINLASNNPQEADLTPLLLKDWVWRYEHKQNIIASASGQQGSGKSMFLSSASIFASNIFGVPFYSREVDEVLKKHLSFDPEELDLQLENSGKRETFLNDEDRKAKVGVGSNLLSMNLTDKEEQLRKDQTNLFFASPRLQDHVHFFVFELKHILFNEDNYPKSTIAVLKTPRYTDPEEFVWRGYVTFPIPSNFYLEQYDPLKDQHIINLKQRWGNTLNPVEFYAEKLFEDIHEELITTTKEGFIKPISKPLMEMKVAREIGTRKFVMRGYENLYALLKSKINERYEGPNIEVEQELKGEKEKIFKQKREEHERNLRESRRKRDLKLKMLEMNLENENKKQELKAKRLKLQEEKEARKRQKKHLNNT